MAQLILSATQQVDLSVLNKDRRGNPAPVQGAVWASTDPAILTVEVDPANTNRAVAKAVGVVGAAMVTYIADADLADGVVEVIATLDVVVNPGQAVVSEIVAGAPGEQP